MTRAAKLSFKAIMVATILSFSFGAKALPMSPKWMKSDVAQKVAQPPAGALGDANLLLGPLADSTLPLPGSIWLILVGVAGMAFQRRNKSAS